MKAKPPPVVLDERAVNVFTDGSSLPGPRRGGLGYVIVTVDANGNETTDEVVAQGFRAGNSQQMELMACVEALRDLGGRRPTVDISPYTKVVIHTDSMYVANNFYNARFVWPRTQWMTLDHNPVLNVPLWKDLTRAAAKLSKIGKPVEIIWHKGHSSSNPHNKTVDKLAKQSAKGLLREPVAVTRVRRKTSSKMTEAGSIRAEGQMVTLRIIEDQWLNAQRMYRYRAEVVSPGSSYFGNVDHLYAERDVMLDAGHTYQVRLNDDPRSPRIVKVYREIVAEP